VGWSRKSFRAPNHRGAARQRRLSWLQGAVSRLSAYDPDVEWLATWSGYLNYYGSADCTGYTLAAAWNRGCPVGDGVLDVLLLRERLVRVHVGQRLGGRRQQGGRQGDHVPRRPEGAGRGAP